MAKLNSHIFFAVLALVWMQAALAQIIVPVMPEKDGPEVSSLYRVEVRPQRGTDWQTVPVIRCDVNTRRVQQAAFAEWDMGEPVVVRIVNRREGQGTAPVVRPSSRGIVPTVINDSTVEFTLLRPEYLSVEFNGDRFHNLHLFANSSAPVVSPEGDGLEEWGLPALNSSGRERIIHWQGEQAQDVFVRNPGLIYFCPGVHKPKDLPSGDIRIPSNCTVYLAPGAVVKARLLVDHAENVCIIGRGIVDHPLRGVEITYSKNILLSGITFLNPAHYTVFGGESSDITVRDIKSFSARPWSDGIDLMCCRRVHIENCFLRTSDDCIALYNHRWWYWGGSEDIDVSRCILWPDVAHPVNIGSHGDDRNGEGETLQRVAIHDCDILGDDADGLGLLAVNCGDNNHVRNIHFTDIRAEGLRHSRLFDLRVLHSPKYNRAPGCCIDSIWFTRISVDRESAGKLSPSRVKDYDAKRSVQRFFLDDIRIGDDRFSPVSDIERQQ